MKDPLPQQQVFPFVVSDEFQMGENNAPPSQVFDPNMWDTSRPPNTAVTQCPPPPPLSLQPSVNVAFERGVSGVYSQQPISGSSFNVTPIASAQIPPSFDQFNGDLSTTSFDCCWPNGTGVKVKRSDQRPKMTSFELRRKQRAYVSNLESHVGELTTTNMQFQNQLYQLTAENKRMKDELSELRAAISSSIYVLPQDPQNVSPLREPYKHPIQSGEK